MKNLSVRLLDSEEGGYEEDKKDERCYLYFSCNHYTSHRYNRGTFFGCGRTKLSQEVITTSADLALNTVLSQYDKDLKDYFGLMASCQDTSEVIELSKEYFVDSMVSAGVTTSDAEAYADTILSAFTEDDDISDMLRLSVEGETEITPTENGALNNPALMKKEIVEFMKYRAPVNGVASLFDEIKESDVSEQVKNASAETDMVEAKKEFYEAERKLIEQAEIAYEAIKKYQNYTTSATGKKITEEEFLNDFSTFLASPDGSGDSFETIFREAHEKMVMNLHNTHDTNGTLAVNLIKTVFITTQAEETTYSDSNRAGADMIKTLLEEFNKAVYDYCGKREALNTAWNNVGARQNSDYPIQYWVLLTESCSSAYSSYVAEAEKLWRAANKLENAVSYASDGVMETTLMKKPDNAYVSFEEPDINQQLSMKSVYDTLIGVYNGGLKQEATGGGSQTYKNINSQIAALDTWENEQKLDLRSVSHIYTIRDTLNKYYNDFDKASKLAETAEKETEELKKLLKKYKEAFDEWKEAANVSELDDSKLALEVDRKDIENLEKTGIELFSEESVTNLAGRLENIRKLCETFRDDIKAIKYRSTAVLDISGYTKFRSATGIKESKIVRNENELRQYASDLFSFTIGTRIQWIEIRDGTVSETLDDGDAYVITDSFHMNLKKTKLELLEWMKQKFDTPIVGTPTTSDQTGFDVSDKESAKKADEDISDKSEDTSSVDKTITSENISGHSFSEWDGAALPSKGEGAPESQSITADIGEVGDFAADIFTNFTDTFGEALVNTRDDLYMMDYVFSMFTYDTFENEGCYALVNDDNLKLTEAQQKYKSVKEDWKNSKENKTLTLTPRDVKNNWAYGGEVEYILYGNASNAANKTTAYAQIYMIRYALDIAAVFNEYWDNRVLDMVATALQTYAFIPASLTKILACLAITAAEAGVDIAYLKAGIPVVLCKGADDLFCSYQSLFMDQEQGNQMLKDKIALQYSDYLKIFLFVKLLGKDENVVYVRTSDVIQANMTLVTGNKSFEMAKSQVYFDLKATVLMEPMWSRLLAIDNLGDLSTSKGWRTTTIEMTRGY